MSHMSSLVFIRAENEDARIEEEGTEMQGSGRCASSQEANVLLMGKLSRALRKPCKNIFFPFFSYSDEMIIFLFFFFFCFFLSRSLYLFVLVRKAVPCCI